MAIDKRYIKKEAVLKPVKRIVAILCIAAIISAVLICMTKELNYQMIAEKEIHIASGTDIQLRGKGMFNDTIYLDKDITVDANTRLGSAEHPFKGVFDGQGHTVTFNYTSADRDTSFFTYITEEAIVQNVTFVYQTVSVNDIGFGGIAKVNEGTIKNCKVVFDDIILSNGGIFSPFVAFNRGKITNVVAQGTITNVAPKGFSEETLLFGSVCVYNAGTLESLLADVEYSGFKCTDSEAIRQGIINESISAVRYVDIDGGTMLKAWAIVPEDQVCSDKSDLAKISTKKDVYLYSTFFDKIGFDVGAWQIVDNDVAIKGNTK